MLSEPQLQAGLGSKAWGDGPLQTEEGHPWKRAGESLKHAQETTQGGAGHLGNLYEPLTSAGGPAVGHWRLQDLGLAWFPTGVLTVSTSAIGG